MDVHHYHPSFEEVLGIIQEARLQGYPVYQLSEVSTISRILGFETQEFVKYINEGVPYLRVQNVKQFQIDLSGVKRISFSAHMKLQRSQLKPKDVVMTITGRVGTVAVVPPEIKEANASQEIVRIRPREEILSPHYLAVYLNSEFGHQLIDRWQSGSVPSRARRTLIKNVRKIPIIIPPKETQNRIVNEVMLLKKQRDHELKEMQVTLTRAKKAVLDRYDRTYKILGIISQPREEKTIILLPRDELNDRLDVAFYLNARNYALVSEYPVKELGEAIVFSNLTIDPSKEPLKPIRYVQIQDVDSFLGRIISCSSLLGKDAPSRARKIVKEGDIITSMSGSATGMPHHSTAIVTSEFDGCVATTGLGILRPRNGIDSWFLYYMLRSSYVLDEIKRRLTGATIPAITNLEFKKIKLPIPPIQIQKEIVTIMREATEESERLTSQALNEQKESERLEQESEQLLRKLLLKSN